MKGEGLKHLIKSARRRSIEAALQVLKEEYMLKCYAVRYEQNDKIKKIFLSAFSEEHAIEMFKEFMPDRIVSCLKVA